MGLHPDVQREKDAAFVWWRKAGTGMKIQNSVTGKSRDNPDFGVAISAMTYSAGKHEIDFNVTRSGEAYCYVGFAVPEIELDKTWCRRDAKDQCWYYFGCGLTNALRNGWDDVVSKEVGGAACKIPRMTSSDRVRAYLDMDAGEVRFALFRPDEPGSQWREMPGKITGITGPVCAAACMQDRCTVALSESCRMSAQQLAQDTAAEEGTSVKRVKVNKYAHVQSKFLSDARLNPAINNMLRQLGEELHDRRRDPPPAHVQLATISMVDEVLPAPNMPNMPGADVSREWAIALGHAQNGTRPTPQEAAQMLQARSDSASSASTVPAPEQSDSMRGALGSLAGLQPHQALEQQFKWTVQQNQAGIFGAGVRKFPRPSSGRTIPINAASTRWSSSAIINNLLSDLPAGANGDLGSPRLGSLTPRGQRRSAGAMDDMSPGAAMMATAQQGIARRTSSQGRRLGADERRQGSDELYVQSSNPARHSHDGVMARARRDGTQDPNAHWLRVQTVVSEQRSPLADRKARSSSVPAGKQGMVGHLELEAALQQYENRQGKTYPRVPISAQRRALSTRQTRPSAGPADQAAAVDYAHNQSVVAARMMMALRQRTAMHPGGAAQPVWGVGGGQGAGVRPERKSAAVTATVAAPPTATATEREEMAELLIERRKGHLGPGVGNMLLRSFSGSVVDPSRGGDGLSMHAFVGAASANNGSWLQQRVGVSPKRPLQDRSPARATRHTAPSSGPAGVGNASRDALVSYDQFTKSMHTLSSPSLSLGGMGNASAAASAYRGRPAATVALSYTGPPRPLVAGQASAPVAKPASSG
jgi:hypothetical protein